MVAIGNRALRALQRANSLNPQADEVWFAIVQVLANLGQPEKARPLIDNAEGKFKGPQAAITLGVCWELMHEKEKAQAKFEEAQRAAPQNSRVLRRVADFYLRNNKVALADPILKQIVEMQSPATLMDACWARRQQAILLRSHGDFDNLCKAVALLDENLGSKAAATEDKHLKVMYLITDPRKGKVGEAIQAMEDLVKSTDATPADYYALAQLYLRKGDWKSYSDQMHSLLGNQKGDVQTAYLVFYISSLLEKKLLDDADNWLQTLEKVDKEKEKAMSAEDRRNLAHNFFETARLRAEYYFFSDKYKDAHDSAMAFLDNPDAQPPDRGQQLLLVAELMEKFADQARAHGKPADVFAKEADKLILSQRRISKLGDIFYAEYLARQKRIRECLEIMEQCRDNVTPENLLRPAQAVVESKAADQAQGRQLEKILLAAADKSTRPVSLLMILARLHSPQRQYDQSSAVYRDSVSMDPG